MEKKATMIMLDAAEIPEALARPLVDAVLKALPEAVRRSRFGEFVSEEDAAELTGLTKRQLRHLREQRRITCYKPNRRVLYRADELIREIQEAEIRAKPPKPKRRAT